MLSFMPTFRHLNTTTNQRSEQTTLPVSFIGGQWCKTRDGRILDNGQISVKIVFGPLVVIS
jgi:hypothetical protein